MSQMVSVSGRSRQTAVTMPVASSATAVRTWRPNNSRSMFSAVSRSTGSYRQSGLHNRTEWSSPNQSLRTFSVSCTGFCERQILARQKKSWKPGNRPNRIFHEQTTSELYFWSKLSGFFNKYRFPDSVTSRLHHIHYCVINILRTMEIRSVFNLTK
jgi:hypothetical protein